MSSNNYCAQFYFFSSFWGSNYKYVILFDIAPQFLNAVFYFFSLLFLFVFIFIDLISKLDLYVHLFFLVCVSSAVEHGVFLLFFFIEHFHLILYHS